MTLYGALVLAIEIVLSIKVSKVVILLKHLMNYYYKLAKPENILIFLKD